MKSYIYIAYSAEQDNNRTTFTEQKNNEYCPGYYADVLRVSSDNNILSVLSSIGGLKSANAFPSKKQAEEVAELWNECYKRNGTYLFAKTVDQPEKDKIFWDTDVITGIFHWIYGKQL